jgi:hypothetical protein
VPNFIQILLHSGGHLWEESIRWSARHASLAVVGRLVSYLVHMLLFSPRGKVKASCKNNCLMNYIEQSSSSEAKATRLV